jgi:hypothetical protein
MLAIRYQGRLVKRMWRDGNQIKLRFYPPTPGDRGDTKLVSQQDWDRYGTKEVVPGTSAEVRQREVHAS